MIPPANVSVWLVRELVSAASDPALKAEQECFVLAANAAEAVEIVGETDLRRIVLVHSLCPITQLPDDKYRVVRRDPITPCSPIPTTASSPTRPASTGASSPATPPPSP